MGICSSALYLHLLEDLQSIDTYQMDKLLKGESVDAYPDASVQQFAELAMAKSYMKKLIDDANHDCKQKAVAKFLACNKACSDFVLRPGNEWQAILINQVRWELYKAWYSRPGGDDFGTLSDCVTYGRTGPGASLLANGTDLYTKLFSSQLSTTSEGLYLAYEREMRGYTSWNSADRLRRSKFGAFSIVAGSKLSSVPKQKDIDRIICTEPSLNMFFQLGLGSILEDLLLRRYGISMSEQPDRNRAFARLGSLDGSFATIDLESASDTIALSLVREIMPKGLVSLINMLRSPETRLPDGSTAKLHMVSSMGNGFTFPLQTLLFTAIVVSVYNLSDENIITPGRFRLGNFGVFGDDIIVYGKLYSRVVESLELFGFRVNRRKSFSLGSFRESCGHDYYHGFNVRGVYLKTLKTEQALYSAINRTRRWADLWNRGRSTLHYLKRYVRTLEVPLWESDDAGLQVPFSSLSSRRYNKNRSLVYKRWVPKPVCLRVTDEEVVGPRSEKERIFNPEGLYLSFLAGCLRQYRIDIRHSVVRYKLKTGIAPNWDKTFVGETLNKSLTIPPN
jgi:hypothetical protein